MLKRQHAIAWIGGSMAEEQARKWFSFTLQCPGHSYTLSLPVHSPSHLFVLLFSIPMNLLNPEPQTRVTLAANGAAQVYAMCSMGRFHLHTARRGIPGQGDVHGENTSPAAPPRAGHRPYP